MKKWYRMPKAKLFLIVGAHVLAGIRYRSIMFTVGNTLSDTDTGTVHCGCGEEL